MIISKHEQTKYKQIAWKRVALTIIGDIFFHDFLSRQSDLKRKKKDYRFVGLTWMQLKYKRVNGNDAFYFHKILKYMHINILLARWLHYLLMLYSKKIQMNILNQTKKKWEFILIFQYSWI